MGTKLQDWLLLPAWPNPRIDHGGAKLKYTNISIKVDPLREFQGAQGRAIRKARRTRGP